MLEVKLTSVSVVVVSDGNNARILNPDFLERNEIVPKGWKTQNVIVTPPIAAVQYENGVSITVEDAKLTFSANPAVFDWATGLPRIVSTYLDVLPHVSYRAVGLNYTFSSDNPTGKQAEEQLIRNTLKDGPWLKFGQGITGVVLELQYRGSQPFLVLRLGVRETIKPEGNVLEGYIFTANLHHDFNADQRIERREYIYLLGSRQTDVLNLIRLLPLTPT